MARTGRQPYDTTDVTFYGAGNGRLRPPATLGEAEKRAFVDLVTTTPAGQFTAADLPLLCAWAAPCMVEPDDSDEPGQEHRSIGKSAALLRQMLACGVSRWHPDPVGAIEAAEAAR